ncbi:MAG: hydrolase, partial [Clostridia bacterium]|nr:hydrolase [Clostridia bacterium]
LPEIPIYIGKGAADVTNAARRYLNKPEYKFSAYYETGKTITVGDLCITPYLCDHSAFDAYMFHIACGDKTLIYSGDFRSNGRKSFSHLLHRLPRADALIVEGTTLSRASKPPETEVDLEQSAVETISKTDAPVFILQAATNIDRLVTAFKVARRSNRVLVQDLYMAEVASAAGDNIPNARTFSGVRVFITNGWNGRHELLDTKYQKSKIGRSGIAKQKFVMCVRPSMQSYLEKLSEEISFDGGVLFYSMWGGYKSKEDIAAFLQFMQDKGVRIIDLHTSGHADAETIQALINDVNPTYIIPVHTENAEWFEQCENRGVIQDKEFSF